MLYRAHHPKENQKTSVHLKTTQDIKSIEKSTPLPSITDYLVVGSGPAGIAAARVIRERDARGSIVIIGEEGSVVIHRPDFSKSLNAENKTVDLQNIASVHSGKVDKVHEMPDGTVTISLADGREISATKGVVIATGVKPDLKNIPVIPDAARSRCLTLRSASDYEALVERTKKAASVVIYGSGYVACELSNTIKTAFPTKTVQILNPKPALLSTIFPDYMSQYIQRRLGSFGVKCNPFEVIKISSTTGDGVKLTSTTGKEVECDLLIIDPAESTPQSIHIQGKSGDIIDMSLGVPCDDNLRVTGIIYCAGDVALPKKLGHRVEHYDNAEYMGRIAGINMTGGQEGYDANKPAFWGNIAGMRMTGLGRVDNALSTVGLWESIEESKEKDGQNEAYRRGAIIYYEDTSRAIKGVLLVNLPSERLDQARGLLATRLPEKLSTISNYLLTKPVNA